MGEWEKARPISNYRLPDLGREHTWLPPLKAAKVEICSVNSIVERNDNTDYVGNFSPCNNWENTRRQVRHPCFMPFLSSFSQSSPFLPPFLPGSPAVLPPPWDPEVKLSHPVFTTSAFIHRATATPQHLCSCH